MMSTQHQEVIKMEMDGRVHVSNWPQGSMVDRLRFGRSGGLVVAQGHGMYQEAVAQGNVYSAMSQTGCIWTVGLATIYTGVCLSNPNGSGKKLSVLAAGFSERVAPAGIQDVSLAGAFSATDVTHSVAGTPVNLQIGTGSIGVAKFDTGATLPVAPKYLLPLIAGKTSAALSTASGIALVHIGGLVELKPGGFVIIACFTVGAAVGQMGCILYQEINE